MKKISTNWSVSGTDSETFWEEINDLDSRTTVIETHLDALSILTILDKSEAAFVTRDDSWLNNNSEYLISGKTSVSASATQLFKLKKFGNVLDDEIERIGSLLLVKKNPTPITEWVIHDLGDRTETLCPSLHNRGKERDSFIMSNITHKKCNLVMRKEGELTRCFSCRGKEYTYIPQSKIIEETLKFLNELGTGNFVSWSIDNNYTQLTVAFPDKAKEISEAYPELPETFTPIIRMSISDVGLSAFRVEGGFQRKDGTVFYMKNEVTAEHNKQFSFGAVKEKVRKHIFENFISIPKELIRLIGIDVNLIDALEEIISYTGLDSKAGMKKVTSSIKQLVLMEMNPSVSYTAYDVVMEVISIPDRLAISKSDGSIEDIKSSTSNSLKKALQNIFYCKFVKSEYILTA